MLKFWQRRTLNIPVSEVEVRHFNIASKLANATLMCAEAVRKAPSQLILSGRLEASFYGRAMPVDLPKSILDYLKYCETADVLPFSRKLIRMTGGKKTEKREAADFGQLVKFGFVDKSRNDIADLMSALADNGIEHERVFEFDNGEFQQFSRIGELNKFFSGYRPTYYPTNCRLDFAFSPKEALGRAYIGSRYVVNIEDKDMVRLAGITSNSGILLLAYQPERAQILFDWFTNSTDLYRVTRQAKRIRVKVS